MLRLITDEEEVIRALEAFKRILTRRGWKSVHNLTLQMPTGSGGKPAKNREVHWNPKYGYWVHFGKLSDRHWICFGLDMPAEGREVQVRCEMNPPLSGVNRRAQGIFAKAQATNEICIAHRGSVNHRRGPIPKDFFFKKFEALDHQYVDFDGKMEGPVHVIGRLAERDFESRLAHFIREVVRIKGLRDSSPLTRPTKQGSGASGNPYWRYIQENELRITPRHAELQKKFESFIYRRGASNIQSNRNWVDVRYVDHKMGNVFVEVKPTDSETVRFAIRAAIGQLLDYKHASREAPHLKIVVETKPTKYDRDLALSYGFSIAFLSKDGKSFTIMWPKVKTICA